MECGTPALLAPSAAKGAKSKGERINVEICSNCHPFFTGKQKLLDTAGRVERFRRKYAKTEKK